MEIKEKRARRRKNRIRRRKLGPGDDAGGQSSVATAPIGGSQTLDSCLKRSDSSSTPRRMHSQGLSQESRSCGDTADGGTNGNSDKKDSQNIRTRIPEGGEIRAEQLTYSCQNSRASSSGILTQAHPNNKCSAEYHSNVPCEYANEEWQFEIGGRGDVHARGDTSEEGGTNGRSSSEGLLANHECTGDLIPGQVSPNEFSAISHDPKSTGVRPGGFGAHESSRPPRNDLEGIDVLIEVFSSRTAFYKNVGSPSTSADAAHAVERTRISMHELEGVSCKALGSLVPGTKCDHSRKEGKVQRWDAAAMPLKTLDDLQSECGGDVSKLPCLGMDHKKEVLGADDTVVGFPFTLESRNRNEDEVELIVGCNRRISRPLPQVSCGNSGIAPKNDIDHVWFVQGDRSESRCEAPRVRESTHLCEATGNDRGGDLQSLIRAEGGISHLKEEDISIRSLPLAIQQGNIERLCHYDAGKRECPEISNQPPLVSSPPQSPLASPSLHPHPSEENKYVLLEEERKSSGIRGRHFSQRTQGVDHWGALNEAQDRDVSTSPHVSSPLRLPQQVDEIRGKKKDHILPPENRRLPLLTFGSLPRSGDQYCSSRSTTSPITVTVPYKSVYYRRLLDPWVGDKVEVAWKGKFRLEAMDVYQGQCTCDERALGN